LLVVSFLGCGDITGELSSITINPSSTSVGINQSKSFSALGNNSVGNIVYPSITWSVEGSIGAISSAGYFTAVGTAGSGNVVATSGSISKKAAVTITEKGWITGVVKTPDGGKASYITVKLHQTPTLMGETNTDGEYSISEIPAGTYEVFTTATQIYLSVSSEAITVASGETKAAQTITLVYQPGYSSIPTTTIPSF